MIWRFILQMAEKHTCNNGHCKAIDGYHCNERCCNR